MQRAKFILFSLCLACATTAVRAVDPIPEAEQGPLVLKLLDAYHATSAAPSPKKLQVVYFTPSDRELEAQYRERLDAIMEDIRTFYRDGMKHDGFGPKTFDLARDGDGKLVIHLVKGRNAESSYKKPDGKKSLMNVARCSPPTRFFWSARRL